MLVSTLNQTLYTLVQVFKVEVVLAYVVCTCFITVRWLIINHFEAVVVLKNILWSRVLI